MQRVVAQGDRRPMAGSKEAMEDLKRILEGRRELYAKADATVDTSGKSVTEAYRELQAAVVSLPASRYSQDRNKARPQTTYAI